MKIIGISKDEHGRKFLLEANGEELQGLFQALSNITIFYPEGAERLIGREVKVTPALKQLTSLRQRSHAVKNAREGLLALAELLQNHEYIVEEALNVEKSEGGEA